MSVYIDQYGTVVRAKTRKELVSKVPSGRVSIMYVDKKDGSTVRCGYVIGRRWFTKYEPAETPA